MDNFSPLDPAKWNESVFSLVANRTFLITCGDLAKADFNTMTGGWGIMGIMWGKPVAEVVVRPTRHTYSFLERYPEFSVCFLPNRARKILDFCGSKSGRNVDKVKECGLHPVRCRNVNAPYFEEAEIVLECRTICRSQFAAGQFLDKDIDRNYPDKDYHVRYLGQILGAWKRPVE